MLREGGREKFHDSEKNLHGFEYLHSRWEETNWLR